MAGCKEKPIILSLIKRLINSGQTIDSLEKRQLRLPLFLT
jgi:hypothetical protein